MQATAANNIETMRALLAQAARERKAQSKRRLVSAALLCTGGLILCLGGFILLRQLSSTEQYTQDQTGRKLTLNTQHTATESRLENLTTAYSVTQDKE